MRLYLLAFAFLAVTILHAQDDGLISTNSERLPQSAPASCTPPAIEPPRGSMFTEAQEADLGDAIADHVMGDFRVIDDDAVAGHLRAIGGRLTRLLPGRQLRFEFFLIEMTEATAFVLPGGRVFVTTKLVGFAEAEDELAGVIAHELGHLLARQQATSFSRMFKRVLNVDKVGDRADIFERYHQLLDNVGRDPYVFAQSDLTEHREQVAADRLGLFLVAAAGYDPQAVSRFFDRFLETKGKTCGFFSNLFGTTPFDVQRLRELIAATGSLPAACVSQKSGADAAQFRQWQAAVGGYTGRGRKESLHGVVSRTALNPPLRGQVQHLRFSLDGAYLLAQDDAGIAILSRAPFRFLFRIEAPDASEAAFSPDSSRVVFMTADRRVETWSVSERRQEQRLDPLRQRSCRQVAVANTASVIACYDGAHVTLLDVPSGSVLLERKEVGRPVFLDWVLSMLVSSIIDGWPDLIPMGFSADGRYFVAGGTDEGFVYDLTSRTILPLAESVRRQIGGGFALAGDRLAVVNRDDPAKSAIVSLPDGAVVQPFSMVRNARLSAPARSPLLLVRPFQKFAVAVMDPVKSQIVKGTENPAIDIHGDTFVLERGSGELGLYDVASNQLRTSAALPAGPLGRIRASAISNDLRWLAFAERSRGGVYDLATGTQVTPVRGFRGAWIDPDGALFVDLPESRQETRRIVQLDPVRRDGRLVTELASSTELTHFVGGSLVILKNILRDSVPRGISVEARDVRGESRWSKSFPLGRFGAFTDHAGSSLVLAWPAESEHARNEARRAPALRSQFNYLRQTDGDYFVQILDSNTGATRGAFFVETTMGSFQITKAAAAGDWLLVEDSANRTRVYALATGEPRGRVFGTNAIANRAATLLAVENGAGRIILYALPTLERKQDLTFSAPVGAMSFSADGKRLFVLTSDQTAFVLDVGTR